MINKFIRHLILSDVSLFFSIGLLAPIFAIFVTNNIRGGDLKVVGLAASMYWISRTLTVIPISKMMDNTKGEKDEYFFMVIGTYAMTLMPIFYLFSRMPIDLYIIGLANGAAASMAVPGWRILFTNHLDKGATGYEWSIEDVGVGIAIAISSYLGAVLADIFGFRVLFMLIAAIGVSGVTIFLVPLYKYAGVIHELRQKRRRIKGGAPVKVDGFK